MSNMNGTGPQGMGPMTGRGMGPCAGGLAWRRGTNVGRGLGRGFNRNWPQSREDQRKALVDYREALEEELTDVKKEIEEISK